MQLAHRRNLLAPASTPSPKPTAKGATLIQHRRQELQRGDLRPSRVEVPKGMIALKHSCLAMVAHTIPTEAWRKPQDLAQKGPVALDLSQSEHSPRHSNTMPCCIESINDIGQQWPEREASSNEVCPHAEDHIMTHTHTHALSWMLLIVLPLPAQSHHLCRSSPHHQPSMPGPCRDPKLALQHLPMHQTKQTVVSAHCVFPELLPHTHAWKLIQSVDMSHSFKHFRQEILKVCDSRI